MHIIIFLKGISKASGLKILESYLKINKKEIMVFGNNYIDIEIMKYAGFRVVMGNAPDKLKKIGDFITDTNDNNGVSKTIERFILI